jgi:hypothetical protein
MAHMYTFPEEEAEPKFEPAEDKIRVLEETIQTLRADVRVLAGIVKLCTTNIGLQFLYDSAHSSLRYNRLSYEQTTRLNDIAQ